MLKILIYLEDKITHYTTNFNDYMNQYAIRYRNTFNSAFRE